MLVRGPDPLETLPRSIRRPPLFKVGRWVASPLPEAAVLPGSVRLEVALWLPVADGPARGDDERTPTWDQVAIAVGRSASMGPLTLRWDALEALAPELTRQPATRRDDRVTMHGPIYPSRGFEGHGSTMARAVRMPGGLLVTLATT
jgi:hypothetical protein